MALKNTPKSAGSSSTFVFQGVKYDPEQWVEIELSRIFWDKTWNVRREHAVDAGAHDDEKGKGLEGSRGYTGLVMSLAVEAQRDPGTVRPNPNAGKVKGEPGREFLGVCGFQRADAIYGIATQNAEETEILTDPKAGGMSHADVAKLANKRPTMKVKVQDLNDRQARALNLKENMQRSSLTSQDVVKGVQKMIEEDPEITSVSLAIIVNQSQPFVAKLMRIAEGTHNIVVPAGALGNAQKEPTTILEAWRNSPAATKITQNEMDSIAAIKDPIKRVEKYVEKSKARATAPAGAGTAPGSRKGKGVAADNAVANDAPAVGAMLYTLQALGIIKILRKVEGEDAVRACMVAAHRKLDAKVSGAQFGAIADAINRGTIAAAKEVNEGSAPAKAEKSTETKGKHKGVNSTAAAEAE